MMISHFERLLLLSLICWMVVLVIAKEHQEQQRHPDGNTNKNKQQQQQQERNTKTKPKQEQQERSRSPNIILFFMDDLGYGDLGFTGHPTTQTPNIDKLAWNGKILTSWYSGCNVCTGSRAALLTGRQFPRTGLPGVIGPTGSIGLPLNETTIAEQLKKKKKINSSTNSSSSYYVTAAIGKWHLGQRQIYLPGNRGFDYYLGIPYSDDMGNGRSSTCPSSSSSSSSSSQPTFMNNNNKDDDGVSGEDKMSSSSSSSWSKEMYDALGMLDANTKNNNNNDNMIHIKNNGDPAGQHLPLIMQEFNTTTIVEQPVDFTYIAEKYRNFATSFIEKYQSDSFFLYVPFSHVHTTSNKTQQEQQYSGCTYQDSTRRGSFGDALAEADAMVGSIHKTLQTLQLEENTLILFTSDNGPWMARGLSGGSEGLFTGRYAGYWNTAKGSTWEGGLRMPSFAYWKGKIQPFSRSSQIISSMDVFPTLSTIAGNIPLPANRIYDGRDMTDILLDVNGGQSHHDFLFFYGTCSGEPYWSVSSVRHGPYKAHWCTAPGLEAPSQHNASQIIRYKDQYPLLFNIEKDPSESEPLVPGNVQPTDPELVSVIERIVKAYAMEKATFSFGTLIPYPDGPGEGPGLYGICCDRTKQCLCNTTTTTSGTEDKDEDHNDNVINNPASVAPKQELMGGIFHIGTKKHHDTYHQVLGQEEPSPPRTSAHQKLLQQE